MGYVVGLSLLVVGLFVELLWFCFVLGFVCLLFVGVVGLLDGFVCVCCLVDCGFLVILAVFLRFGGGFVLVLYVVVWVCGCFVCCFYCIG